MSHAVHSLNIQRKITIYKVQNWHCLNSVTGIINNINFATPNIQTARLTMDET